MTHDTFSSNHKTYFSYEVLITNTFISFITYDLLSILLDDQEYLRVCSHVPVKQTTWLSVKVELNNYLTIRKCFCMAAMKVAIFTMYTHLQKTIFLIVILFTLL